MYGDSQALSLSSKAKENLSTTKSRENIMESEYIQYHQNNQSIPGLSRYHSAPGSLFENLTVHGVEKKGLAPRFSSSGAKCNNDIGTQSAKVLQNDHYKARDGCYAMMNSQLPPQYPRQAGGAQMGFVDGGYGVMGSIGMDHQGQAKMGSNLMRQNSSPAGLFSHLTTQNDFAAMRSAVGGYTVARTGSGELSLSPSVLKGQMNYSSGLSSSLGVLSRISEVENENGGEASGADEKASNENREARFYSCGFPFGSWNDSLNFEKNFSGLKREVDDDLNSFANSQNTVLRNQPRLLSHHLSLPKDSAEMAAMEKRLLHFQDTVPCKIRAKRGYATHPRSIAERVRRTRISEKMKKLQELVPQMNKQTNTADMLDLAVEYIKDLRKQYKTLVDIRSNCKCSALQKPVLNQSS